MWSKEEYELKAVCVVTRKSKVIQVEDLPVILAKSEETLMTFAKGESDSEGKNALETRNGP